MAHLRKPRTLLKLHLRRPETQKFMHAFDQKIISKVAIEDANFLFSSPCRYVISKMLEWRE
jgi:hypothetical protein